MSIDAEQYGVRPGALPGEIAARSGLARRAVGPWRLIRRTAGIAAAVAGLVAMSAASTRLAAQTVADDTPDPAEAEEAAVAVITELFDAMRASDAEAMRDLFADGVSQFPRSHVNREGAPAIAFSGLEGFLESVAGAEPGSLDEQWTVRDVLVDDNLATVITPYAFIYEGTLSHCGVNVFLIARQGEDWKIAGLADTARRQDCEGWLDE